MTNENWKPIKGFEDFYMVSDFGRVRNSKTNHVLRPWKNGGYWQVELCGNPYMVHRLVAQAFIPNPKNKPHIDHVDGDRANARATNLRWVTPMENAHNPITEKRQAKYHESRKGITINNKPVVCVETGNIFKSALDAESKLGIYHNQINKCCLKRPHHNTAGGLHWEYAQSL